MRNVYNNDILIHNYYFLILFVEMLNLWLLLSGSLFQDIVGM